MPWRETCQMDERVKFIAAYLRGEHALTDLCQSFGISRKTAYKWLQRYAGGGVASLVDQSKRPHHSPKAVTAEVEHAFVDPSSRDGPTRTAATSGCTAPSRPTPPSRRRRT